MKAMIFAAGLGTRLKPFTDFHPKALAEVCGRPMLGVVIERLKMAGISEIIVNVHHFADQIVDYLHRNNDFGVRLHISDETSELLDTGGGILAARRWLDGDEPFVVHNADILTDVDIAGMLSVARSTGAALTLLVFGGVHVISPSVFPSLAAYAATKSDSHAGAIPKFSITDFYIDNCSELPILGYQSPEPYRWHDIGKPESLEAAQNDFARCL